MEHLENINEKLELMIFYIDLDNILIDNDIEL